MPSQLTRPGSSSRNSEGAGRPRTRYGSVYASFLLDKGETDRAWVAIKPGRLVSSPSESMLRRWAVAARVSDANGDRETARRLILAIRDADPDIPWLNKYDDLLA
jgi:hypothetical protein